jgi:MFS family permease
MYSAIGSMMLGWDYVSGGQLASLPEFRRQFGVEQPDGSHLIPSHVLSAWQAIGPAAHIIAAIVAAPLLEKWGRKPQIIPVVLLSLGGVILQQYAVEWTLHLAGRAVNG